MYTPLLTWPEVSRDPNDLRKFFGVPLLGLDFEWDKNDKPTVLGLSDGKLHVSVPFADGLSYLVELLTKHPTTRFVGHNIIGADMFILAKQGIELKLANLEDTIIRHWLVNMHLSKSSGKAALEEDTGEKRGRGFNNLWTMSSLYTDFPHWKDCRGDACTGPCPDHDVFGYNGLDAAAPVISLPPLKRTMALRGLEKLYPMHKEVAYRLAQMREFGVRVDVPYIDTLREEFDAERKELATQLPFNAESGDQIKKYFAAKHELWLEDTQEETIREAVEKLGEDDAPDELLTLLDYKELGKGPDRWFKPYYRDKNGYLAGFMDERGYVHPHLGFFTSSARLMCSSPNLQNVAKRRRSRKKCECGHLKGEHGSTSCTIVGCHCTKFTGEAVGKKIRRAIIAPEGSYIVRADYSNAEGRTVLHHAGYPSPTVDMHSWMRDQIGLREDEEFSIALGGAREAAKSVTHASNYLEGLQLKGEHELKRNPTLKREIDAGARIVFPDWKFKGRVVTFTGVNLARRAFGRATLENRARALDVMTRYIDKGFPEIRTWHKRVSKQIEDEGMVRPPHGYVLLSYGATAEDQLKTAVATWGQQPTAHISKLALIKLWNEFDAGQPLRPVLQVHDEVLAYVRSDVAPADAMKMLQAGMQIETPEMPGFVIPAEPSYGPNWRDQKKG